VFRLQKMDALEKIDETFDIVLSFNLLLKRYFPREKLTRGVENLAEALNEDGLLIIGNNDVFSIARKRHGKLVEIERSGDF
jgi:chemotaxis methyl-accepting protein methylase